MTEIEPLCYRFFKQCDYLKNVTLSRRGEEIRISFMSDKRITERGFNFIGEVAVIDILTI